MTKTRKLAILAALACALVLCFSLIGCGNNKANFTGDWTLDTMEDTNIGTVTGDSLASFGMTITLTLKDDGTGTFSMLGDERAVKWDAKSATEMTATMGESGQATFKIQDGKLVGEDNGAKLVFKKKTS